MLVDAPTLVITEQTWSELRRSEAALAIVDSGPYACVAKSDDVGAAILVQVGDKSWMLFHTPTLVVAKVVVNRACFLKSALAITDGRPHTVVAKSNDVIDTVVIQISHEPGMLIYLPASSFQTELGVYNVGTSECAVAIAQRYPHSALAEADDVGESAVRESSENAGMLFN